MQLDTVIDIGPRVVGGQRWSVKPPCKRQARTVAEREPGRSAQRSQPSRFDCINGCECLDGDCTIEQSALAQAGAERHWVDTAVREATEDLGEIHRRYDGAGSDRVGNRLGTRLVSEIGEQHRSVEDGGQLSLPVFPRSFGTALNEQLLDHRATRKIPQQAPTLLSHDPIRAQPQ